jgi:hypothetical protein
MLFAPLSEAELESAMPPEYLRLPKWGERDPYFGLTRTALDQLTRPQPFNQFRPPVKSKILKMAGSKSGIKLISFSSLKIYIDGLPDASLGNDASAAK